MKSTHIRNLFPLTLTIMLVASPFIASAASLDRSQMDNLQALLQSYGVDSNTIATIEDTVNNGNTTDNNDNSTDNSLNSSNSDNSNTNDSNDNNNNTSNNSDSNSNNANSLALGGSITNASGVANVWGMFCHTFNTNLGLGSVGNEVASLKEALAHSNLFPSTAINSDPALFSSYTQTNVMQFQAQQGIVQTGFVGPMTRAALNRLYGCTLLETIGNNNASSVENGAGTSSNASTTDNTLNQSNQNSINNNSGGNTNGATNDTTTGNTTGSANDNTNANTTDNNGTNGNTNGTGATTGNGSASF